MNPIKEHKEIPKIGVGVIITKNGKVLLGKRKNAHGDGTWSFPGGHLEFGESIEDCAKRETMEETGIKIKNLRKFTFTNDIFEIDGHTKERKHYVTLFIKADYESGSVKIMEPDKCGRWEWFSPEDFPEPLFLPVRNLLKERKL